MKRRSLVGSVVTTRATLLSRAEATDIFVTLEKSTSLAPGSWREIVDVVDVVDNTVL